MRDQLIDILYRDTMGLALAAPDHPQAGPIVRRILNLQSDSFHRLEQLARGVPLTLRPIPTTFILTDSIPFVAGGTV